MINIQLIPGIVPGITNNGFLKTEVTASKIGVLYGMPAYRFRIELDDASLVPYGITPPYLNDSNYILDFSRHMFVIIDTEAYNAIKDSDLRNKAVWNTFKSHPKVLINFPTQEYTVKQIDHSRNEWQYVVALWDGSETEYNIS